MINEKINIAIEFAKNKHKGQLDDLKNDYFESHIFQVFKCISIFTSDEEILCASLLHDTLEDTNTSYEELIEKFGKNIAGLVMEVTHEGKKDSKGFYFPRLESKKAIMIKFADRLSNISRMENWSEERQNQYLKKSKFWKSE